MSKSLGNLVTIDEFLQEHEADVFRLIVLSSHYRKPLGYDEGVVADAEKALQRLRGGLRPPMGRAEEGDEAAALEAQVRDVREKFLAAMDDDFNTAGALGHVFTLVRAINTARDAGVGGRPFARAQATLLELAHTLGLELKEEAAAADVVPFIEHLIEIRSELRKQKQWALADRIRDRLNALGVALEDTPQGTVWRWKV